MKLCAEGRNAQDEGVRKETSGHRDEASGDLGKERPCLVDLLLQYELEDHTLSSEEVLHQINVFTYAGHDTSGLTLAWALWRLAKHQDVQEKLRQEIVEKFPLSAPMEAISSLQLNELVYLDMFLKEVQRLYPVAGLLGRKLDKDLQLKGFRIPAGTDIWYSLYHLHRNAKVFPEPHRFDPERFRPESGRVFTPYEYAPFGAGPRNCIAYKYALLSMKSVLVHLVRGFLIQHGLDANGNDVSKGKHDLDKEAPMLLVPVQKVPIVFKARS
jgi:cytochrome P450 family 4